MIENNNPWILSINNEINSLGLTDLYQSNIKYVILYTVYDRMCNVFKQNVIAEINESPKYRLYKNIVDYFCMQMYLKNYLYAKYKKLSHALIRIVSLKPVDILTCMIMGDRKCN
jgi:hypothetical protein